jgi:hypothetical protein
MSPQFNSMNELTSYLEAIESRVKTLENENARLRSSIAQVEQEAPKRLPETGLLSRHFMKRAFTVWGHNFVISLIISLVVGILMGSILLIPGLFPWINNLFTGLILR